MSDIEQLKKIFSRLNQEGRRNLLDYADFLAGRYADEASAVIPEPQHLPRPKDETVVAAIKRLSGVYHMVDRSKMLHETSGLMAQHLMQGRDAEEVIDELEQLFLNYYEKQCGKDSRQ